MRTASGAVARGTMLIGSGLIGSGLIGSGSIGSGLIGSGSPESDGFVAVEAGVSSEAFSLGSTGAIEIGTGNGGLGLTAGLELPCDNSPA